MKTEKNILIAFLLNLAFAVFALVGGLFTGSVAILSDAVHDLGDATSIGVAYFLEKKSKKAPDQSYTYGYARYAVLGGVFTTLILLLGSVLVIRSAILRIVTPAPINYDGMLLFAIIGAGVNLLAALVTREGDSLGQRAVNLHMLEDVLGWLVVLVGAIVMHFTDAAILDPLLSIGVAVFVLVGAIRNLREALLVFLEQTPPEIDISALRAELCKLAGVLDVHHIHAWSLDGHKHCATMHIVAEGDPHAVKDRVRTSLRAYGICHATLELESEREHCHDTVCQMELATHTGHHHHHHHHHHG